MGMTNTLTALNLKKLKGYADWKLLLFLLLFLNVKLIVKVIAIVIIYLLQRNFKFGFKLKNSRLPLFYLLIIPIAFVGLIVNNDYHNTNYIILFLLGISCWLLAILAAHQIKLLVDNTATEKIDHTLIVFFIINAIVSVGNLLFIIWQTGSINPYTFTGLNQQYFINTGDNIKGITFDISSTNAVLCAFGVFYFLLKNNFTMLMVCMTILLLTYSNLITLIFVFILLLVFIFKSTRGQKSMILVCLVLYVVFLAKISPQNENYINQGIASTFFKKKKFIPDEPHPAALTLGIKKADSSLTPEGKRRKIAKTYLDSIATLKMQKEHPVVLTAKAIPLTNGGKIFIAPPPLTPQNYISHDTLPDRKQLLDFISLHKAELPISSQDKLPALPGKLGGAIQTIRYLKLHPQKSIVGLGLGNFSSKIAFRAAGAGIRGGYSPKYVYINPAFMANHLDLYLSFFSKHIGFRSVRNNPYSVYDQMLSEYGFLGLFAFLFYYLWFFAKHYKTLTYGLPILLLTIGILFIDYWFEQLSVLVFFELMLFLNIKETAVTYAD